jgi:hypothetical protein
MPLLEPEDSVIQIRSRHRADRCGLLACRAAATAPAIKRQISSGRAAMRTPTTPQRLTANKTYCRTMAFARECRASSRRAGAGPGVITGVHLVP